MNRVPDAAELVAHQRWIRALARTLVVDASAADDLVQDTWVAALESGPRSGPARRGWLATILRRRAAETRRESASRARREESSARAEALPSTLAMIERAAVQRDLVQAVLDLEEPYRTTILWRFFEELPPREIARRAGAPVATVHSRIQRGLDKLRRRLDDDRGGDGRAWALALAPLVRTGIPGPAGLGAVLVKTSTSIGIAAACAAAVVALCVLLRDPSSAPAPRTAQELATPAAAREDAEPRRGAEIDAPAAAGERVAGEVARPAIGAAAPIAPPHARILSGEVLDETGRRLGDVALRFDRGAAPAPFRSDAAGRFETELPAGAEQVLSDDPRWSTVLAGSAIMAADTVSIVVVAPRIDLAGTVVDEDGAALLGADVGVYLPRSFGSDFRRPLDASANRQWDAVTDAEGRFGLPDVPSVEGAALHVVLGGFDTSIEALPIASDPALRIVLRRPRESTGRLAGIVVDPRGGLVRGARVSAGFETAISDERGRFELDLVKEPAPTKVTAAKPGFLPAVREPDRAPDDRTSWPDHVVLRLGSEPRGVEGRVLDGEGHGLAGARVWLEDPTYFGLIQGNPAQVETLLGPAQSAGWGYVTTDAEGAFRIEGLLERAYRLRAMDPETLLAATSEPVEAGAREVRIRLPRNAVHETVKGRVVARDGTAMADVSVVAHRSGFSAKDPWGWEHGETVARPEVRTDAEGRFTLRNVAKEGVAILVHGEAILFAKVRLGEETDVDDVRIVVNRRMHLQVELDPPVDRADEVRVLDGEGQPMDLVVMRGESSFSKPKAEVVDGRSQVLSLSEDAKTAVLYKAGVEVARIPVALRAGEITRVR